MVINSLRNIEKINQILRKKICSCLTQYFFVNKNCKDNKN